METSLYDAALLGNVSKLEFLLEADPLIIIRSTLIRTSTKKSALHISAEHGHLEFTKKILQKNPELANEPDLHKSLPLHLAAARGHVKVVKTLIGINTDMCFSRDEEGRNPIHVAAIKGRVNVLDALVQAKPDAAKETARNEETILHLCVKYNRLDSLKMLVNLIRDPKFLNCKDREGDTVLHLAVSTRRVEMVEFLLSEDWIHKNIKNTNGLTSMDIYLQSRAVTKDIAIHQALKRAKIPKRLYGDKHLKWLEDHRSSLLVVASLIAQMAFQAGTNPPGGYYQDGDNIGYAVAGMQDPQRRSGFFFYLAWCAVSLLSSLSIILLLISGLRCQKFLVYISVFTIWVAIVPVPWIFGQSIALSTNLHDNAEMAVIVGALLWFSLPLVLVFGNVVHFIIFMLRGARGLVNKVCDRVEVDTEV